MSDFDVIYKMVRDFFKGDDIKTIVWLETPNPMLGKTTPRSMIKMGQFEKLKRFIETSLRENENPAADAMKTQQGAEK